MSKDAWEQEAAEECNVAATLWALRSKGVRRDLAEEEVWSKAQTGSDLVSSRALTPIAKVRCFESKRREIIYEDAFLKCRRMVSIRVETSPL